MDERLRFVARLLDGEAMSDVCREFGISRKTGYKIFNRYKELGLLALSDRSRRPVRYANQLPAQVETLIVALKRDKPHWGARKIRELLVRRLDQDIRIPAKSTIHAVLHRHGLVKPIGRPRHRATGTALSAGSSPNELWCADFKGKFKLGNGQYCYPLTVTDFASRYLLACEGLASTRSHTVNRRPTLTLVRIARLSTLRPPRRDPHRRRRALRCTVGDVRVLAARGVVAALRHLPAAHQARQATAERPARAHASHAQE